MKVIGLCGGSGSGKGEIGRLFSKKNIPVIDTDAVYHELTSQRSACLDELAECFGDSIIDEKGSLDRAALAKLVFAPDAQDKRRMLNKVTHKHILAKTREHLSEFSASGFDFCVVDAPLLFESGFNSECDIIVSVIADKSVRVERIMARDLISCEAAEKRIASQLDDEFLIKNSDFVISNNGTLDELNEKFDLVLKKIKNI